MRGRYVIMLLVATLASLALFHPELERGTRGKIGTSGSVGWSSLIAQVPARQGGAGSIFPRGENVADVLACSGRRWGSHRTFVCATLERQSHAWRTVGFSVRVYDLGRLTALDCDVLEGLGNIERLEFAGHCQLAPSAISRVAKLSRLRKLTLPCNLIEADIGPLFRLAKLEDLDLSNKGIGAASEKGLARLAEFPNLRRLNLYAVGLDAVSLRWVAPLKSLERLSLRHNDGVTDASLADLLAALGQLHCLRIDSLGPKSVAALTGLPKLEELDVAALDLQLGGEGLSALRGLKRLRLRGSLSDARPGTLELPSGLRQMEVLCDAATHLDLMSCKHVEQLGVELGDASEQYNESTDRWERTVESMKWLSWLSSLPELRELALDEPVDQDMERVGAGVIASSDHQKLMHPTDNQRRGHKEN